MLVYRLLLKHMAYLSNINSELIYITFWGIGAFRYLIKMIFRNALT